MSSAKKNEKLRELLKKKYKNFLEKYPNIILYNVWKMITLTKCQKKK